MFYTNSIEKKNIKYETKTYPTFKGINADSDENLLDLDLSPLSYNFDFSNGSLKDGLGIESLSFRSSEDNLDYYKPINGTPDNSFIKACWYFTSWASDVNIHRAFVVVYTSVGDIYYNRLHSVSSELVNIEGLNFSI